MALITCYECGNRISTAAANCPKCGAPNVTPAANVSSSETKVSRPRRAEVANQFTSKEKRLWVSVLGSVLIIWFFAAVLKPERSASFNLASSTKRSDGSERKATEPDSVMRRSQADSLMRALPADRIPNVSMGELSMALVAVEMVPPTPERSAWLALARKEMTRHEGDLAKIRVTGSSSGSATGTSSSNDASLETTIQSIAPCKVSLQKVKASVARHPFWSSDVISAVVCGRVHIGMTAEQARAAWGAPSDINRTTYSFGVREQWVYDGGYLYFEDGVLTAIQN